MANLSRLHLAPHTLDQPINPGWIFAQAVTVNEHNSSAPATEREIVAAESYGRQLGRISDALAALIAERPATAPPVPELEAFGAMRDRIEDIKDLGDDLRQNLTQAPRLAIKGGLPAQPRPKAVFQPLPERRDVPGRTALPLSIPEGHSGRTTGPLRQRPLRDRVALLQAVVLRQADEAGGILQGGHVLPPFGPGFTTGKGRGGEKC